MIDLDFADMVGTLSYVGKRKVRPYTKWMKKMAKYQRQNWQSPITAIRTANTPQGRAFIKEILL